MPTIQQFKQQEDRKRQAYQHFINKGYSPEASAGIVGNLVYESGLDTSIEGDKGYKGGSSFGIAQFRGGRLKRLKERYGENWTDLNNQLDFVDWELNNTHKKAGNLLKQTEDVHSAGQIFSDYYEIPAKKYNQNKDRANKVEQVYQTLVVTPQNTTSQPTQEVVVNQEYITPTKSTTAVTNLPLATNNVNFTAEINKLEQQAKERELSFLKEYQSTLTTPEEEMVQEEMLVKAPKTSLTDIFNQVSQFVDSPVTAQQGAVIRDNIPNLNPKIVSTPSERQFLIDYIMSPAYKENLIKSGYKDVDGEIEKRLKNVEQTNEVTQFGKPGLVNQLYNTAMGVPYSTNGSAYDEKTHTLISDPTTDKEQTIYATPSEIKAHELTHSEISLRGSDKNSNNPFFTSSRLNEYDEKQLFKRQKKSNSDEPLTGEGFHNMQPAENKADLNALKYLLQKEGIYNPGKEKLKKEHLNKLNKSFVKDRLLENYKEEDLIWLMNNIAMNDSENSNTSVAQQGGKIINSNLPDPINGVIYNPQGERTYYDDRLDRIVLTPQSNFAPRESVINHEKYHKYQFDSGLSNYDIALNTENYNWARMQKRPQLPTTEEVYYDYHNRKPMEVDKDIEGLRRVLDFRFVPNDILFDKIIDQEQYSNPKSFEGEAMKYENSLIRQQGGMKLSENEIAFLSEIAVKDQEGQRKFPNRVVEIQGDTMATDGYGDIALYVIPNIGKPKVIQANTGEHIFKGATKFIEIPIKNINK